jgi:hypothetical protein
VINAATPVSLGGSFGPVELVLLAIAFGVWAAALLGWGLLAADALGGDSRNYPAGRLGRLALATALGSLAAATGAALCGELCLVGSRFATIPVAFVVAGVVLLILRVRWLLVSPASPGAGGTEPRRDSAGRIARVLVIVVVADFLLRFVQATVLARHGDPLSYHLVGPVLWVRAGGVAFDPAHPLNPIASLWDALYIWPAQVLTGPGERGLVALQLFAQWTHLLFGWAGIGLATAALLRVARVPPALSALGALAALSTRSLWWPGALAKNDCGAATWVLAAMLLVAIPGPRPARRLVGAGLLLGAAFVGKYTTVFTSFPLVLLALLSPAVFFRAPRTKRWAAVALLSLGALAGSAVVLARNARATGNPVFPVRSKVIPLFDGARPTVSATRSESIRDQTPSGLEPGLSWRFAKVMGLLDEGPLAILSLVGLAAVLVPKRFRGRLPLTRSVRPVLLVGGAAFLLFLLGSTSVAELRYAGPGLVLLNVGGTLTAFVLLRFAVRRFRALPKALPLLAVLGAVAGTSRIAPEALLDLPRRFPLGKGLLRHTAGDSKEWIRSNAAPDDAVVTSGDDEIYYLLGRRVSAATDDLALDALWRGIVARGGGPEEILVAFRRVGFRWLLDTDRPGGEPWPGLAPHLVAALAAHPEFVAFQGASSRVVDLERVGVPRTVMSVSAILRGPIECGGSSSVGRASDCGSECRGFDPRLSPQFFKARLRP